MIKIVRFLGGLGNQMFQYTFYKALKKRFPDVRADLQGYKNYPLHNGFELEKIFGIKLNNASSFAASLHDIHNRNWIYRKLRRLLNVKTKYQEESTQFSFDPSFLSNPKSGYYWGYWQNQAYFEDILDEIRSDFDFKNPLETKNQIVLDHIKTINSVSIHVRRGDYLKDEFLGGLCGQEYYQRAIEHIRKQVNSPGFFVFSDDIAWCRDNLGLPDASFISWNKGASSYIDMQLMSHCKHNIIANSSFSWWAAWLNNNPDKIVIAPKKWINFDGPEINMVLPDKWTAL